MCNAPQKGGFCTKFDYNFKLVGSNKGSNAAKRSKILGNKVYGNPLGVNSNCYSSIFVDYFKIVKDKDIVQKEEKASGLTLNREACMGCTLCTKIILRFLVCKVKKHT